MALINHEAENTLIGSLHDVLSIDGLDNLCHHVSLGPLHLILCPVVYQSV